MAGTSAFLSYASEDRHVAERIHAALNDRGVYVWLDRRDIQAGQDFEHAILDGLSRANYGVLLVSQHSLRKPWPKREFEYLINRGSASRVIPVYHKITPRARMGLDSVIEATIRAMQG
jgi:hypothetical protein